MSARPHPALVPELDVTDLDESLRFYVDVCGFAVRYERRAEAFACLSRDGAELMLEAAHGPGRRFRTVPLERPFGRGVNLQIEVCDIEELHRSVVTAVPQAVIVDLEERWYDVEGASAGNRQFVVADPDGYLLRFFQDLGVRTQLTQDGQT